MILPIIQSGTFGAAHIEYRACREEVEKLLVGGYSVSVIYRYLKETGRKFCGYSVFCDYVHG
ncbi:MAG: TraK family protein [Candidatus Adiutrix intracellularis]|jgi:hypothetical protein|nr:TraK family protein [Candidatus Adiutrix intracellularis]